MESAFRDLSLFLSACLEGYETGLNAVKITIQYNQVEVPKGLFVLGKSFSSQAFNLTDPILHHGHIQTFTIFHAKPLSGSGLFSQYDSDDHQRGSQTRHIW